MILQKIPIEDEITLTFVTNQFNLPGYNLPNEYPAIKLYQDGTVEQVSHSFINPLQMNINKTDKYSAEIECIFN